MLNRATKTSVCLLAATAVLAASPASAQTFGPFAWQMQPYCNIVTLTLTNTPAGYVVTGLDDQCGAAAKASAFGMASFTANGSVSISFTVVMAPTGQPLHVSAMVSPTSGTGTWTDSAGNSGTFAFFAAAPGLPARPLASSSLGQNSITSFEIAPGSVGASEINAAEVQMRVGGACTAGAALTGVNPNGTVSCAPIPPPVTGACPAGQAVAFVNANGSVACAAVQQPVTGACPAGEAVTSVNTNGSVNCAQTSPASIRFRGRTAVSVDVPSTPGDNARPLRFVDLVHNVGGGTYDASTGDYAVPVTGTYLVTGSALFEKLSNPVGNYCLLVAIGGGLDTQSVCLAQALTGQVLNISTVVALQAGQTVTLAALNPAGGVLRASGAAQIADFTVTRLH